MTTALQDGEKRFEYDTYNTLFFGFIHVVDKLAGTGWRKTWGHFDNSHRWKATIDLHDICREKNKSIGDDTKAAAHQSLNCIKNKKKIKYSEKRI